MRKKIMQKQEVFLRSHGTSMIHESTTPELRRPQNGQKHFYESGATVVNMYSIYVSLKETHRNYFRSLSSEE